MRASNESAVKGLESGDAPTREGRLLRLAFSRGGGGPARPALGVLREAHRGREHGLADLELRDLLAAPPTGRGRVQGLGARQRADVRRPALGVFGIVARADEDAREALPRARRPRTEAARRAPPHANPAVPRHAPYGTLSTTSPGSNARRAYTPRPRATASADKNAPAADPGAGSPASPRREAPRRPARDPARRTTTRTTRSRPRRPPPSLVSARGGAVWRGAAERGAGTSRARTHLRRDDIRTDNSHVGGHPDDERAFAARRRGVFPAGIRFSQVISVFLASFTFVIPSLAPSLSATLPRSHQMSAILALSSAASIMLGGLLGGG